MSNDYVMEALSAVFYIKGYEEINQNALRFYKRDGKISTRHLCRIAKVLADLGYDKAIPLIKTYNARPRDGYCCNYHRSYRKSVPSPTPKKEEPSMAKKGSTGNKYPKYVTDLVTVLETFANENGHTVDRETIRGRLGMLAKRDKCSGVTEWIENLIQPARSKARDTINITETAEHDQRRLFYIDVPDSVTAEDIKRIFEQATL